MKNCPLKGIGVQGQKYKLTLYERVFRHKVTTFYFVKAVGVSGQKIHVELILQRCLIRSQRFLQNAAILIIAQDIRARRRPGMMEIGNLSIYFPYKNEVKKA